MSLQFIPQEPYRFGSGISERPFVHYGVPMHRARAGMVDQPEDTALDGPIGGKTKFIIRIMVGVECMLSRSNTKNEQIQGLPPRAPQQRNMKRSRDGRSPPEPLTRARLAEEVYDELKKALGPHLLQQDSAEAISSIGMQVAS